MKSAGQQATLQLTKSGVGRGGATLKTAGASTLGKASEHQLTIKPDQTKITKGLTFTKVKGAPKPIETVWDEDSSHTLKTRELVAPVVVRHEGMAGAFEDATQGRKEQRQMMNDMHAYCNQQVKDTDFEMKGVLDGLAESMEDFAKGRRQCLKDTMADLERELEEKVGILNANFAALEARAAALQAAINVERASRVQAMEEVLAPVREQVQRLTTALEKEREIRRNRDKELRKRLDAALKELEEGIFVEQGNRQARFDSVMKDVEKDMVRLQKRQKAIDGSTAVELQRLQADIVDEKTHRVQGQDRVAHKLQDFIQNFRLHIKEEGDMGN